MDKDAVIKKLQTTLIQLDANRKDYLQQIRPIERLMQLAFFFGIFLIFRWNIDALNDFLFPDEDKTNIAIWYSGIFPVLVLIFTIWHNKLLTKFKTKYGQLAMPIIMDALGDDFQYEEEFSVDKAYLKDSKLFLGFSEHFTNDAISGTNDGINFRYFQLTLSTTSRTNDVKSASTSFKGLMFETECGFGSKEWWLTGANRFTRNPNKNDEGLKLEHPELKNYRCYQLNQEELNSVAPIEVQERIAALNRKLKNRGIFNYAAGYINYHFTPEKIQLSIPTSDSFLALQLSASILKPRFLNKQLNTLVVVSGLTKDLNRFWKHV